VLHRPFSGAVARMRRWRATSRGRQGAGQDLVAAAVGCTRAGALLIPIGRLRLIDGDEGYYLQAARLVSGGQRIYTDFSTRRCRFGAHVYAAWFWLWGRGCTSARLLASLLAVGTGLLVLEILLSDLRAQALGRGRRCGVPGHRTGRRLVHHCQVLRSHRLSAVSGRFAAGGGANSLVGACGGLALALAFECRLYVIVAFPCALLFLCGAMVLAPRTEVCLPWLWAQDRRAPASPYVLRDWHNSYFGNWTYSRPSGFRTSRLHQ